MARLQDVMDELSRLGAVGKSPARPTEAPPASPGRREEPSVQDTPDAPTEDDAGPVDAFLTPEAEETVRALTSGFSEGLGEESGEEGEPAKEPKSDETGVSQNKEAALLLDVLCTQFDQFELSLKEFKEKLSALKELL
jgi:hypothetical protein